MIVDLNDVAEIHEARLDNLEDSEIDALIEKLESWSTTRHNWLGVLQGKDRANNASYFEWRIDNSW